MDIFNKDQAPSLSWELRNVRLTRPCFDNCSIRINAVPHSIGISEIISLVLNIESKQRSISIDYRRIDCRYYKVRLPGCELQMRPSKLD